jgi:hypothetical protein
MNNKIVVLVSILLMLSFFIFAAFQKQQADILKSIAESNKLQLEECKRSNVQLLQNAEAQRALAEDMQRIADIARMEAYEQRKLAESKSK